MMVLLRQFVSRQALDTRSRFQPVQLEQAEQAVEALDRDASVKNSDPLASVIRRPIRSTSGPAPRRRLAIATTR